MREYEKAKEFYDYIIKNNGYSYMTTIYAISCLEESLQAYDMDLILSDTEKEEITNLILNTWLDCEEDLGISKITDLIVENYNDLKGKDNIDELIDDIITYRY